MSQNIEQAKFDLKGWTAIADYLGVGVCTVRKWARLCELPVTQVSERGMIRASKLALDSWAKSHRYDIKSLKKPEVKTT